MSLRLTKIEEGINDGEVLYHAFVEKSTKEIAQLRKIAPQIRLWILQNLKKINKKFRKKRLRHEKQVEHSTIRKMRNQSEKEARLAEMDNKQRQSLIQKQREVTGDYSEDSDSGPAEVCKSEEIGLNLKSCF